MIGTSSERITLEIGRVGEVTCFPSDLGSERLTPAVKTWKLEKSCFPKDLEIDLTTPAVEKAEKSGRRSLLLVDVARVLWTSVISHRCSTRPDL